MLRLDAACLGLSDGRCATARVASGAPADLVLFDLALDYTSAQRIAVAQADQAAPGAIAAAAGLFQCLGKQVSVVEDSPGLIVLRTVAMLANEALEAVLTGVATPADIDRDVPWGELPRRPAGLGRQGGCGAHLGCAERHRPCYRRSALSRVAALAAAGGGRAGTGWQLTVCFRSSPPA